MTDDIIPTNDDLLILSDCQLALGLPQHREDGSTYKIQAPIGWMAKEIISLRRLLQERTNQYCKAAEYIAHLQGVVADSVSNLTARIEAEADKLLRVFDLWRPPSGARLDDPPPAAP